MDPNDALDNRLRYPVFFIIHLSEIPLPLRSPYPPFFGVARGTNAFANSFACPTSSSSTSSPFCQKSAPRTSTPSRANNRSGASLDPDSNSSKYRGTNRSPSSWYIPYNEQNRNSP